MSIEFVAVRLKRGSNIRVNSDLNLTDTLVHNPIIRITNDAANNFFMVQAATRDTPPCSDHFSYDGECVWNGRYVKGLSALDSEGYRDLIVSGRGSFSALVAYPTERDFIVRASNDPLGLYPLCYYIDDNVIAFGNQPRLIAEVLLKAFGVATIKIADALINELLTTTHLNDAPYQGMKYVPFDTELCIDRQGEVSLLRKVGDYFYFSKSENPRCLLEEAVEEVAENVRALADAPYEWKICDITGGMDSRLVLAAILKTKKIDNFFYNVQGRLPSPDVNVANLLMNRYGLQKIRIIDKARRKGDILHEMRIFSYISNGAKNNIDRSWTTLVRNDQLFLVGGGNSGYYKGLFSRRLDENSLSAAVKLLVSNSTLVAQAQGERVTSFVHRELQRWVDIDGMTIGGALNRFYVEYRARYVIGLCEHWGRLTGGKAHPLYSPAVMRLGFRVPEADRNNDRLTFQLLEKMYPDVLQYPLEGRVWPAAAYHGSNLAEVVRALAPVTRDTAPLVAKPPTEKILTIEYPTEAKAVADAYQAAAKTAPRPMSEWRKLQLSKGRKWHWVELEDIQQHARNLLEDSVLDMLPGFEKTAVEQYLKQDLKKLSSINQAIAYHNICMGIIFHADKEIPIRVYSPENPVVLREQI